ncbi:hypothetical protein KDW_30980 [Dictyobacter vulcani]|uniref:Uncharacterized protein n=1 Tax=Dictyobacter vulcani TaxID=2607529 RepID=A0A5J4KUM7_9CHLR|nr:hypothetical protein [Dictyobacter vulcani]GER88936.1 hypothetical protein KDW_30980 [Dictyobacter vulcani]
MALKTLFTTHDYTERTASLKRHIVSLERRRDDVLHQIEVCKKPINMVLTLFIPLYRRSLILEVRRLRQEVSSLDGKILDVQAEYDALCAEQQQRAQVLEENERLAEQEAQVQREYRWMMLQENQRKLKRQKAALEKAQEHDRLQEEAVALQRQHKELQQQLSVLQKQLGDNRDKRKHLDDRIPNHILIDADSHDVHCDEAVAVVSEIFN